MKAYFLHLDAGFTWDKSTLTYTFWYASGDDDPEDDDFEGYVAVDVDSFDNHVLFESLCDDNVFTERHYFLDKGFVMNRVRFDYQATDKLKAGVAAMYMMTAEDIEYIDNNGDSQKNDKIGFELDAKRMAIVDSWPAAVDDRAARADWRFDPEFVLDRVFQDYLIPGITGRA